MRSMAGINAAYGPERVGYAKRKLDFMVRPTGIEPVSKASEALILSIKLRAQGRHCSVFMQNFRDQADTNTPIYPLSACGLSAV